MTILRNSSEVKSHSAAQREEMNAWAEAIIRSGIGGAVPLPYKAKTPTPAGFQGGKNDYGKCLSLRVVRGIIARGFKARDPQSQELIHYDTGGLAIRPADGVIIIDIDCYNGKRGAETLAELEEKWGELPPTYYLTARGVDSPSRKLMYRASPGRRYGNPGGDIEILQPHHRYAVCYGVHPEGMPVVLYGPDGEVLALPSEMPELEDLAELPEDWDDGLAGMYRQASNGQVSLSSEEAREWLLTHGYSYGESCDQTDAIVKLWCDRLSAGKPYGKETEFSVHNTGRDAACAIIRDCVAGHKGAWMGLAVVRDAFFRAGEAKQKYQNAMEADWSRSVREAIEKYSVPMTPGDPCFQEKVKEDARQRKEKAAGRLVFTNSTRIQPRNPDWVWEDRMPLGALVLSAGRGGAGKSLHADTLVADASQGRLPGCWLGEKVKILWATVESSLEIEVVPRFMAAGGDRRMLTFVSVQNGSRENDHIRIFDPAHIGKMKARVSRYQADGYNVIVVLDPVLDVLDSIRTSDQQEVRAAIGRLNTFAEEMGILVIGIAHFNKMTTVDSAIDRITGSAAFSQRPRAVIAFAYNKELDEYVISQAKNNWGKTDALPNLAFSIREKVITVKGERIKTALLEWGAESEYSVDDLLSQKNSRKAKESPKTDAARAWLAAILSKSPVEDRLKIIIIAAGIEAGYSQSTIENVARDLGVVSVKTQVKGTLGRPKVAWALPEKLRVGG